MYGVARPDTLLASFLTNGRGVFRLWVSRAVRQMVIRPPHRYRRRAKTLLRRPAASQGPITGNFIKILPGVISKNGNLVDGRKVPSYYLNGVAASEKVVRNLPLELVARVELLN